MVPNRVIGPQEAKFREWMLRTGAKVHVSPGERPPGLSDEVYLERVFESLNDSNDAIARGETKPWVEIRGGPVCVVHQYLQPDCKDCVAEAAHRKLVEQQGIRPMSPEL